MDEQKESRGQPSGRRQLLWAGAVVGLLTLLTIAILIGYRYGITLWDWIKLLVVPAVIVVGGFWFNALQRKREQRIDQLQKNHEQQLANDRAQDEAVQAYLDQLTHLLVTEKEHGLFRMDVDDDALDVIRARSESLLRSVDSPTRKWSFILFLSVMGLLARDSPLISLAGANLRDVDGRGAPLEGIDLASADLSGAHLSRADLSGADLANADLANADLSGADLRGANLSGANLKGAHMDPLSISLSPTGALMKGRAVLLQDASLRDANLEGATLFDAQLEGADLSGAYLSGADLSGADLRGAKLVLAHVTEEQLEHANTLEGATMPNGLMYEDWLKDRKGDRKDGENPDSS
jgi:uncharacterized protein YjbI with pentapeptide repeats